jgi:DNA mismatch repair ATPase MutS
MGDAHEVQHDTAPLLDARGLGHPLLPDAKSVRNDLRLDGAAPVAVVTGSNMSGKSTLLRTVGVNVILAQAGAPVRATSLRLSPLQVAASLRTLDSLQSGASQFYAEITCLRRMIDLTAGPRPVLALLDELLHGTNSHDREVGGAAFVRGLVDRGALGLVTTHDLALARVADELQPRVRNAHFECTLANGELQFDSRLQPGVVRSSNAIELMRAVGLAV